jgi:hypothetical protein
MPNRTIANRIAETIAAFERDELGATAIADSVDLHEPALEGVPRSLRDALHKFSVEAVRQDFSPLELEMLGLQPTREAVESLKLLLSQIE